MKVYSVNAINSPWVGHGYEPVAFFSTRERAEAVMAGFEADRTDEQKADPEKWGYGYEVDEWDVDDPRFDQYITPTPTGGDEGDKC